MLGKVAASLTTLLYIVKSEGTCPYFTCPSRCDDLELNPGTEFYVCSGTDCTSHCYDCDDNFGPQDSDPNQLNTCTCHANGCDQCDFDGENPLNSYWKLNYDYGCQHCGDTFPGCLQCSDFHGCQQCSDGYTRTPAVGCGSESDQYNPEVPVYYCLPNGEEPCDGFGEEDDESPPDNSCYTCPEKCELLHIDSANHEVCAYQSCSSNCLGCDSEYGALGDCDTCDPHQLNTCTCHDNGCDQCDIANGYFKINYDFPCVQCQEVFGQGCLHCTDFLGCQQCADGYELIEDTDCGSDSDQYSEGTNVHYCRLIGDDCQGSGNGPNPTPKPTSAPGDDNCDCTTIEQTGHQNGPPAAIDIINNVYNNADECCEACHLNESCQSFTYLSDNQGEIINSACYLFSTLIIDDAIGNCDDCTSGNVC